MARIIERIWGFVIWIIRPIRIPAPIAYLLAIYSIIPDNKARIDWWVETYKTNSWVLRMMEPLLTSPWLGIALIFLGTVYLYSTRGVVHVHHIDLEAVATATATVDATLIRGIRRDAKLGEALMWVVTGEWGKNPFQDETGSLSAVGDALHKFHQLARDGAIKAWGRPSASGVYEPVDPVYWSNYHVDFLDTLRENAQAKRITTGELGYEDVMVSKGDFEKNWPR